MIDPFTPTDAIAVITLALLLSIEGRTTLPTDAELESYADSIRAELEREMTLPTEALLNGDSAIVVLGLGEGALLMVSKAEA